MMNTDDRKKGYVLTLERATELGMIDEPIKLSDAQVERLIENFSDTVARELYLPGTDVEELDWVVSRAISRSNLQESLESIALELV